MSSLLVDIKFDIPLNLDSNWKKVITVLQEGKTGADFQDVIDVFGVQAADKLEMIFEGFGTDCFEAIAAKKEGTKVFFKFEWPLSNTDVLYKEILNFLALCGGINIQVDSEDLSGD